MAYQFDATGKIKTYTQAELLAADEAGEFAIVLDYGTTSKGAPYWAYIAVKPSRYKEFMRITRARKSRRINDYGTILKHGFDNDVPAAVREEMKRNYGCDDQYMEKCAKEVKAAQVVNLKQREDKRIGDIVAMLKMKQAN